MILSLKSPLQRSFIAATVRKMSVLSSETFKSSSATASPTKSMVCLHGILGSKKNWRTPSNIFTKKYPEFQAIAIDHRGHGSSSKLHGVDTVESCAQDVLQTLQHKDLPAVFRAGPPTLLCGHSFSGKVVMSMLDVLIKANAPLPEHVWILDSMPGVYDRALDSSHQQSVIGIINTIMDLPAEFESKLWIESLLTSKGISRPIVDWLSTNIIPVENPHDHSISAYRYSFDIETVHHLFEDFCEKDMWGFLENYQGTSKIHFIRAGKNRAWTAETLDRFAHLNAKNSNIMLHTMPNVGHWLHAEDVHGMLDIIATQSGVKK